MTRAKQVRRLEQAAGAPPATRGPMDADAIGALVEAAVADTAAGRGYPPDLDGVRRQFESEATEEGER
jgi:hypothetical protein